MTKTGVQTNKDFRKLFTLFLRNKGFLENVEIMLTEKDKIFTEEKKPVKNFQLPLHRPRRTLLRN